LLLIIGSVTGIVITSVRPTVRSSPEDTVRAFVEAAYRSDCAAVRATIDDAFWEGERLNCLDVSFHGADFADTTVADWTISGITVTGDLAKVTLDPPGGIPPTDLHLRLIDGIWKITSWVF